eukprot:1478209-Rhodomonas_salina.2
MSFSSFNRRNAVELKSGASASFSSALNDDASRGRSWTAAADKQQKGRIGKAGQGVCKGCLEGTVDLVVILIVYRERSVLAEITL